MSNGRGEAARCRASAVRFQRTLVASEPRSQVSLWTHQSDSMNTAPYRSGVRLHLQRPPGCGSRKRASAWIPMSCSTSLTSLCTSSSRHASVGFAFGIYEDPSSELSAEKDTTS
jgi:hypothetical protein